MEIVLISDETYAAGLAVAMTSVLKHASCSPSFHVIDVGIELTTKLKLEALAPINWVALQPTHHTLPHTAAYCSKATWAKLMLPSLLPTSVQRVLYLDVDLLVLDDVAELWAFATQHMGPAQLCTHVMDPVPRSSHAPATGAKVSAAGPSVAGTPARSVRSVTAGSAAVGSAAVSATKLVAGPQTITTPRTAATGAEAEFLAATTAAIAIAAQTATAAEATTAAEAGPTAAAGSAAAAAHTATTTAKAAKRWQQPGGCIAAVRDFGCPHGHPALATLGWQPRSNYFNAGVLLLDLHACRSNGSMEQALDIMRSHHAHPSLRFHDQDVLNLVFQHAWLELPLRWNVQGIGTYAHDRTRPSPSHGPALFDATECARLEERPSIVHFTGPPLVKPHELLNPYVAYNSKPWAYLCSHPWRHAFWSVLRERTSSEEDWLFWAARKAGQAQVAQGLLADVRLLVQRVQAVQPAFNSQVFKQELLDGLRDLDWADVD